MRRYIIMVVFASLLCLIDYACLYNGFSGIESISIQKDDHSKTTMDHGKISSITGILNRADHEPYTVYKLAVQPTYNIHLSYKDKPTEKLTIHKDFGTHTSLIKSDAKDGYFKVNKKQTEKILNLLLD
ncbi:hypothetical protein [Falsibacillus albus]|uniref:Uncharacterized protein n=1 Tax=Falsibacillus albus TaxID=2478915 RepID=A0A3L7JV36_9BACI|nr:hypothetical protein [Falsibacillus albus]RLQ94653.1 hypothetical protein D9X91_14060 [Falsibacillus albus]